MNDSDEIIVHLLEYIYREFDDIDGDLDASNEVNAAEYHLLGKGWTRDGLTGTTWIRK